MYVRKLEHLHLEHTATLVLLPAASLAGAPARMLARGLCLARDCHAARATHGSVAHALLSLVLRGIEAAKDSVLRELVAMLRPAPPALGAGKARPGGQSAAVPCQPSTQLQGALHWLFSASRPPVTDAPWTYGCSDSDSDSGIDDDGSDGAVTPDAADGSETAWLADIVYGSLCRAARRVLYCAGLLPGGGAEGALDEDTGLSDVELSDAAVEEEDVDSACEWDGVSMQDDGVSMQDEDDDSGGDDEGADDDDDGGEDDDGSGEDGEEGCEGNSSSLKFERVSGDGSVQQDGDVGAGVLAEDADAESGDEKQAGDEEAGDEEAGNDDSASEEEEEEDDDSEDDEEEAASSGAEHTRREVRRLSLGARMRMPMPMHMWDGCGCCGGGDVMQWPRRGPLAGSIPS